ncbi:hypothetical protein CLCR_00590 [Cladophialophora carrionii]|uniref:Uncharacterized protein n=1 Tax=Cladophialophora carrionii TaxID=86049 RepID=A0A1C1C6L7_9EURO|nr:hypothetical protein CLCR_00590 [Cladophialophora carrionii]
MPSSDDTRDPASVAGSDSWKCAAGPNLDIGRQEFINTPIPSSMTDKVDPDKEIDEVIEDTDNMANVAQEPDDAAGLRQFVYQPRRAAIKAGIAIEKSRRLMPLVANPSPVKTRKRKAPERNDSIQVEKPSVSALRTLDSSSSLPVSSGSPEPSPKAKKPRLVARKGIAVHVNEPRRTAIPEAARAQLARRSVAKSRLPRHSAPSESDGSYSPTNTEDDDDETVREDSSEPENEDSGEEDCPPFQNKPRRSSVASSNAKLTSEVKLEFSESEYGDSTNGETTPVKNVQRAPARSSAKTTLHSKAEVSEDGAKITSAKVVGRVTRSATAASTGPAIRMTRSATRAKPPTKPVKYPSPGTLGCLPTQTHASVEPECAEYTPSIDPSDSQTKATDDEESVGTRSDDDLKVDPPGSGTAFDALKWPQRLLKRVNRSGTCFPEGWGEEEIRSIPDAVFVDIRKDLLALLRYDLLLYRPWELLKTLPDSSPFWIPWEKDEGRKIIHSFISKVENERAKDCENTLLELARVPTELAPSASNVIRSRGLAFGKFDTSGNASTESEENYIRTRNLSGRPQDLAGLGANNLLLPVQPGISPNLEPTTLDYLVLAAEVIESGTVGHVRGNLSRTTQDAEVNTAPAAMSTAKPRNGSLTVRPRANLPDSTPSPLDVKPVCQY